MPNYTRMFTAIGSRAYEIKRRKVLGGFSYQPLEWKDNTWARAGKRRVFKTFNDADLCGTQFIG